ncbi:LysR family transcriptional regulator [Phyllobacterium myrsinacearum]|uniref:DNA-binding transcriptional LysR family regulator n=1 Tax=Phyllobacterium myrsinacearum TaxID=28101 RepID=A0A839EP60_9HYPH|nr:LysR family transcriptional regulator [Phyllobacterium myrsinacearum]MBA8880622.1 DNA-binding transcriptional LysR family regulator [Phyllobacterium myrsinacearum]
MIDWQDLHYFSVLARTGSLSAAARELGVDHATVGRRVASLEQSLSLHLVDRLPRRSPLTAEGTAIAELVAEMTSLSQSVERRARGLVVSATATVRISAPPAVAARLIAPHVVEFHREHPDIMLALAGAAQNAALDRSEADLAVRMIRPTEKDLLIRRIGAMRFALYATREQAERPPAALAFIAYDATLDHLAQQVWLRSILAGRPIIFQASDLFGQQEAARAGLGAAVLPCFMGDGDSMLVRLPVDKPPPVRDLWLTAYPDVSRSPAMRTVMTFLADIIGRECPIRASRSPE